MNIVIPKPVCDINIDVSIRYSATSKRIYLESSDGYRGGCITLGEVWDGLNGFNEQNPLYSVNLDGSFSDVQTGTWLLTEDLYIEDGVTLDVIGGDADELRLLSNNDTFINLRAHGGSLNFDNTRVLSWDLELEGPDEDLENGRSYISCLSEVLTSHTCNGTAKNSMREGRMDISDSEMSYLGYHASESWGLSYKVRGFCTDKSNPELFDSVGVYGNIYDSEIHHNYYGHYSYGHIGGDWSRNVVHSNVQYGFDPHDRSRNLTIHDNVVYDNGNHGIIASKWCSDVSIQGNTVYNSKVGIFLHSLGDRATVKNNTVYDCFDTGITFFESSDGLISGNTLRNNAIGMRFSVGSKDNIVEGNSFIENGESLYMYEGNDKPVEADESFPNGNVFFKNDFKVVGEGIRLSGTSNTQFLENTFTGEVEVELSESVNVLFLGNTGNLVLDVSSDSCLDPQSDIPVNFCDTSVVLFVPVVPVVVTTPAPTVVATESLMVTMSPTIDVVPRSIGTTTSAPTVAPTVGLEPNMETSVETTMGTTSAPTSLFETEANGSFKLETGMIFCIVFVNVMYLIN